MNGRWLLESSLTRATTGLILLLGCSARPTDPVPAEVTSEEFAREVQQVLPEESTYAYHKRLSEGPVHVPRREGEARPRAGELVLPEQGWKLAWNRSSSHVFQNAVRDFQ